MLLFLYRYQIYLIIKEKQRNLIKQKNKKSFNTAPLRFNSKLDAVSFDSSPTSFRQDDEHVFDRDFETQPTVIEKPKTALKQAAGCMV